MQKPAKLRKKIIVQMRLPKSATRWMPQREMFSDENCGGPESGGAGVRAQAATACKRLQEAEDVEICGKTWNFPLNGTVRWASAQ